MNLFARRKRRTPDLEVLTWTHPAQSSDRCVIVEGRESTPLRGWFGVADMIGRPARKSWRKYMGAVERQLQRRLEAEHPPDAATHHALMKTVLREHNRYIHDIAALHDTSAFGFCVCFASVFDRSGRIFWLGDCRAYRIRHIPRPAPRGPEFEVEALTRDNNALDRFLREKEGKTLFFRNELLELSKRLDAFLGIGSEERISDLLDAPPQDFSLDPDTCLMLVTDGFTMPLIRDITAVNNGLDLTDYYLESWLARLLEREAETQFAGTAPNWPAWIGGLTAEVRKAATRHPDYKDDVALVCLYPSEKRE